MNRKRIRENYSVYTNNHAKKHKHDIDNTRIHTSEIKTIIDLIKEMQLEINNLKKSFDLMQTKINRSFYTEEIGCDNSRSYIN